MACNLFVQWNGYTVRAGIFRNRESAELYWERSKQIYRQKDGTIGKPIFVETGKGRGK